MAKRGRAQGIPIEVGALGAQHDLAGEVDKARDRDGIAVDQIAAADRPDFGIDPVLRPKAKKASGAGLLRVEPRTLDEPVP
jgi:hypothetical protein